VQHVETDAERHRHDAADLRHDVLERDRDVGNLRRRGVGGFERAPIVPNGRAGGQGRRAPSTPLSGAGTVPWQLYIGPKPPCRAGGLCGPLWPGLHSQKLQHLAYRAQEGKSPRGSNVGFPCNFKRIVDLDAEVAHSRHNLGMTK
jgi:hypothetical protein